MVDMTPDPAARWNARRPKVPAGGPPRAGELECQTTIVQAAKIGGWYVHAERAAKRQSGNYSTPIQGHAGFPDLVLIRNDLLLYRELKRAPNKVEPDQGAWLDKLYAAGADVAVWWVPEELDRIVRFVTTGDKSWNQGVLDAVHPTADLLPPDMIPADWPPLLTNELSPLSPELAAALDVPFLAWFCPDTNHRLVTWHTDEKTGRMTPRCDECGNEGPTQ